MFFDNPHLGFYSWQLIGFLHQVVEATAWTRPPSVSTFAVDYPIKTTESLKQD